MASERALHVHDDLLEVESPLEQRLRSLRWPTPPPGAHERGLEALKPMLGELYAPQRAPGESPILH